MRDRHDIPRPRPANSSSDGTFALLAAVVSRAAVLVVAIVAAYLAYRYADAWQSPLRDLLITPWTRKDAGWFVNIAREGYHAKNARTAFFPLYPLLIRATHVLFGGSYWTAGLVLSSACYGGAMLLLFRLAAEETTSRAAAVTVLLISVFPTAFVFSAVYSESLFLLLTVAAFLLARNRRWALACLMGCLAMLTRSSGLLLLAPLLLIYAEQREWTWRRPVLEWPRDARLAWLLLIPTGLLVYMGYLWARFGDALLFAKVQRVKWNRTPSWPWEDVWRGAQAASKGLRAVAGDLSLLPSCLLPVHELQLAIARLLLPFAALLFASFCLVVVFRRLPLPYGVYALLALLLPLSQPSSNLPLYSFHRFVVVVFPLFIALALTLERRRAVLWTFAVTSFVLMLYFTVCFTSAGSGARGVV